MQARTSDSRGARAALRDATSEVHERLHVAPGFLAIAEGRLGLRGYRELMSSLAGIYFALAPELGLDARRMDSLRRDLADLDAPAPAQVTWTRPRGSAEKLGWQYVVEGSIFGGQVIYRQLDYLLGAEDRGRRFFAASPGAADRWRSLCREFERVGEEGDLHQMIAGSRAAFDLFERHLGGEVVHD